MPELPDISLYVTALANRLVDRPLRELQILSPFVLRSVAPAPPQLVGHAVRRVSHLAKQIVISLDGDLHCVIHLMIAGRLRWEASTKTVPRKSVLAVWSFDNGSLWLTEAGKKRRASIHLLASGAALAAMDRGGLDPLTCDAAQFRQRLGQTNHTLKRALTDQRIVAGIGNAYSDEILFAARLSPLQKTNNLSPEHWQRLHQATVRTLQVWSKRLSAEAGTAFPRRVTAFRAEMAVHGRYGLPCRICRAPVQRIQYASNEANYCARCQTNGRILSDRVLARLLKSSWPKTIEELE